MGHGQAHMGNGVPPSLIPYSSSLEPVACTSPVDVRATIDVDGPASWSDIGSATIQMRRQGVPVTRGDSASAGPSA